MKALTYHGPHHVKVENVPDPGIEQPDDIILRVTATAICGSDLHLYRGKIPQVKHGDIFGHEFMGEVVETGHDVKNIRKGDRVVIPFVIACGDCFFCRLQQYSACENTNDGHGAIPINFDDENDPAEKIIEQTAGHRGVDAVIDAVGFEAKGSLTETVLTNLKLEGSSGKALRQCIAAVRRGGVVSVPGVYAGFIHGFLFGDAFDKGLTFKMGQTHVHAWLGELLPLIEKGLLKPEEIVTHYMPFEEAARGYEIFEKREEECRKVILVPGATSAQAAQKQATGVINPMPGGVV